MKRIIGLLVMTMVAAVLLIGCGGGGGETSATIAPKMFVTASAFSGDIKTVGGQATAIASADHLCMVDANKPAGGGTYKAMLVDGTNRVACTTANCSTGSGEHINWVFKPNTTYYRSNGTTPVVTTGANGIWDFGGPVGGNLLTNTTDTAGTIYWTGLEWNWTTVSAELCGGIWSDGTAGVIGDYGFGDRGDASSIGGGSNFCSIPQKLLCIEQ